MVSDDGLSGAGVGTDDISVREPKLPHAWGSPTAIPSPVVVTEWYCHATGDRRYDLTSTDRKWRAGLWVTERDILDALAVRLNERDEHLATHITALESALGIAPKLTDLGERIAYATGQVMALREDRARLAARVGDVNVENLRLAAQVGEVVERRDLLTRRLRESSDRGYLACVLDPPCGGCTQCAAREAIAPYGGRCGAEVPSPSATPTAAEVAALREENERLRDVLAMKGVTRTAAAGDADLILMGEGHPAANGRQPVAGEQAWTFRVLLDDGRKLDLKLGRGDRDEFRKMMLAEEMDDASAASQH